jgi:hypothetical protein
MVVEVDVTGGTVVVPVGAIIVPVGVGGAIVAIGDEAIAVLVRVGEGSTAVGVAVPPPKTPRDTRISWSPVRVSFHAT